MSLKGKTVIITGANSGIGREVAFDLARRGARIILACRDGKRGQETIDAIRRNTQQGELVLKVVDLASFKSIHDFVNEIIQEEGRIDILVNNAGVFQCPFTRTEDGFEMQMGVNYLGHFLLTNLLLPLIEKSSPSRIVMVSSGLAKKGVIDFGNLNSEREYNKAAAYKNSKLALNYFSRELAFRLAGSGVGVHCLHPGMVRTNLGRHIAVPRLLKVILYPLYVFLVKSAWDGCQTVLYCCMAEELEGVSGRYYGNCAEEPWPDNVQDDGLSKKLWEKAEVLTKMGWRQQGTDSIWCHLGGIGNAIVEIRRS